MKVIAISIGDCQEDLEVRGYGPEHLDLLATRLVRYLLRWGFGIAYGGILRNESFLRTVTHAVQAESVADADEALSNHLPIQRTARLFSYQPWPACETITAAVIADHLDLVRYVKVYPGEGNHFLEQYGRLQPSDLKEWIQVAGSAVAMTRMRTLMMGGGLDVDGEPVPECTARIIIGGKPKYWLGGLPGIAEEALATIRAEKPLYLLGGYGGIVNRICNFLLGQEGGWDELTYACHVEDDKFLNLKAMLKGAAHVHAHFDLPAEEKAFFEPDAYERAFREMVSELGRVRDSGFSLLNNGLDKAQNIALMKSENVIEICQLIQTGLSRATSGSLFQTP